MTCSNTYTCVQKHCLGHGGLQLWSFLQTASGSSPLSLDFPAITARGLILHLLRGHCCLSYGSCAAAATAAVQVEVSPRSDRLSLCCHRIIGVEMGLLFRVLTLCLGILPAVNGLPSHQR